MSEPLDWAFCTPVPGEACAGWGIYVAGKYGMDLAVTLSELLPKGGEPNLLDDAGVALYEKALDAFVAGDWNQAFALLHEVPPWDQGKDFLTSHILSHRREPPPGWEGVVALESK
jgi:adenylate cyclase